MPSNITFPSLLPFAHQLPLELNRYNPYSARIAEQLFAKYGLLKMMVFPFYFIL